MKLDGPTEAVEIFHSALFFFCGSRTSIAWLSTVFLGSLSVPSLLRKSLRSGVLQIGQEREWLIEIMAQL